MLYDELKEYSNSGIYPMHMPGHKRNAEMLPKGLPYDIDITEINGFDNLHDPEGILKETAQLAAKLYGSSIAFPLINGSTVGILATIGAYAKKGEKIIMARNCHLSVYNAVALFELSPIYIMPLMDENSGIALSIDPAAVEEALESNPDVKLVVLTSPTYEGIVSDIGSIAQIAHKRGVPLFVDEAHGAHFGFSIDFPIASIKAGADVVVTSLHKTLPALTQCALLLHREDNHFTAEVARLLGVFQTTSPSYILMASIDSCLRLLETQREELFSGYMQKLRSFNDNVMALEKLLILRKCNYGNHPGIFDHDPGKIVVLTHGTQMSGVELSEKLRNKYKIELEMASAKYAIAMTSICDSDEGFIRLSKALVEIDNELKSVGTMESSVLNNDVQACDSCNGKLSDGFVSMQLPMPVIVAAPSDAINATGNFVALEESIGRVSLEYIWAYPPGVPIIAPGERISVETVEYIIDQSNAGVSIKSTKGSAAKLVYVAD
ncbi:MAG: aminotransferase class I/II-fold pyridoxal phosphate-dependent enzyme [Oscillospiraceae bacterium]|nr:aminotransferase class I/II-fold pyridoxal phosphate-dependent enzyme [Oscillospiraceae bacterium]